MMVELKHRQKPVPDLEKFLSESPAPDVSEFKSLGFQPVKKSVKAALNEDQMGLCVYCERKLKPEEGHVEHIKPKGGRNAYPELCFEYTNYAQSCDNKKTCGHKKSDRVLPIEPAPGCNREWRVSTSGRIVVIKKATKRREDDVRKTCDIIGLNDPGLVVDRKEWLQKITKLMESDAEPEDVKQLLESSPYRFIFETLFCSKTEDATD